MRNKDLIANVPSISCAENYFLGWCAEQDIGAEILFNNSYLPAAVILNDFIAGVKFESYNRIERVMETAERCGAVRHTAAEELSLINAEKALNGNGLVLIEVNGGFFENIALKPWRGDHYIWLTGKTGNVYTYLNNYPLSAGEIKATELYRIYGGKTLVYYKEENCAVNHGIVSEKLNKQIRGIADNENFDFELPEKTSLQALRDGIGILKITRRRLAEWFKALNMAREAEQFMKDYYSELCSIYVWLEAFILRKRFDLDKMHKAVNDIIGRERELSRFVKESIA